MEVAAAAGRLCETEAMLAAHGLHKLHGLGNDFLVGFVGALPDARVGAGAARRWCHRRHGIGADGLILAVLAPGEPTPAAHGDRQGARGEGTRSQGAKPIRISREVIAPAARAAGRRDRDFPGPQASRASATADLGALSTAHAAMRLWNSDGSAAEVSGNGLRCLAHALARASGAADLEAVIETEVGARRCRVRRADDDGRVIVSAEMGELSAGPRPTRCDVSVAAGLDEMMGCGFVERWDTASVGNPHIVLAVHDPAAVPLRRAGPAVEALFDGGVNVHFGAVTGPQELTLTVWERGAGVTQACGTGAVAAAAVFHRWGAMGEQVRVRMAGGDAEVDLSEPVTLTGESAYVAEIRISDD